ncbi:MAG: hypothetical protein ACO1N0_17690 [Fluviicola sp.]
MEIHMQLIGVLLIILALIHTIFPKYFNWKEELKSVSLINRQMMIVHTFFIALAIFLMGLLCLTYPTELIETKLGKIVSLGFGIFWGMRLFIQLFGYSSKLWKGKMVETIVHISFIFLWTYLSVVFFCTFLH